MKKLIIVILIIPFIWMSCEEGPSPELNFATIKADSLQTLLNERDETVNEFFETFNEIEENLATIKEKENIITMKTSGGADVGGNAKDQINDDILMIYELLENNKKKIAYLNKKLNNSNIQILELNKMIARLTEEINSKDSEIGKLKEELEILNILVEDLNANIDTLALRTMEQGDVIDDQDIALNTAFYVYGTSKELKEQQVITKTGGFVGIGAVEKLIEDFNKDYFTKIDIRTTKKILLMSKKAKIVTTHPSSSYTFDGPEGQIDNLIITDHKAFWSTSKYLVVVVD